MKIVSLATLDWGGNSYFLSQAIRETTEHRSRAVRLKKHDLDFPHDLMDIGEKNIEKLLRWCDVVHIHDAFNRKAYDKPVVMTYHGTRYRNHWKKYNDLLAERGWFGTVSTVDLTRFGLPYLPDCRPDLSEYYDPPDEFTVAHAPTNRRYKGTERVIAACEYLGVKLVLVENTPWQECLELKGRAHVLVDQFTYGYGNNAIEAWSMGMPVISDAFNDVEAVFIKLFGDLPYVKAGIGLESLLDRMRLDESWRRDWADMGREHYLMWHSYEAVAAKALEYYQAVVK